MISACVIPLMQRSSGHSRADADSVCRHYREYLVKFKTKGDCGEAGSKMRPERLELPTFCSEDRRSVQLSYGRKCAVIIVYLKISGSCLNVAAKGRAKIERVH